MYGAANPSGDLMGRDERLDLPTRSTDGGDGVSACGAAGALLRTTADGQSWVPLVPASARAYRPVVLVLLSEKSSGQRRAVGRKGYVYRRYVQAVIAAVLLLIALVGPAADLRRTAPP